MSALPEPQRVPMWTVSLAYTGPHGTRHTSLCQPAGDASTALLAAREAIPARPDEWIVTAEVYCPANFLRFVAARGLEPVGAEGPFWGA